MVRWDIDLQPDWANCLISISGEGKAVSQFDWVRIAEGRYECIRQTAGGKPPFIHANGIAPFDWPQGVFARVCEWGEYVEGELPAQYPQGRSLLPADMMRLSGVSEWEGGVTGCLSDKLWREVLGEAYASHRRNVQPTI